MRIFVIYFSMLTFLFSELFGLIKNEPIPTVLLKSIGAFILFLIIGNMLAAFIEPKAKKEDADSMVASPRIKPAGINQHGLNAAAGLTMNNEEQKTEALKQEALQLAREKPKEVAKVFETLISQ
jgi:flagellar biosynthesis/type III secretory pathway M-ring protein FliF/YscJ